MNSGLASVHSFVLKVHDRARRSQLVCFSVPVNQRIGVTEFRMYPGSGTPCVVGIGCVCLCVCVCVSITLSISHSKLINKRERENVLGAKICLGQTKLQINAARSALYIASFRGLMINISSIEKKKKKGQYFKEMVVQM